MAERIPQSVALRVMLKAYLTSDHVSAATGKTIAVVISKNAAAFGNPSAGATNATELSNGWYYVDLSTTDTGTLGPLVVRGTVATVDDVEVVYNVVNANNAGLAALPNAAAEAAGGLYTRGTGAGQINQSANGQIDANTVKVGGTTQTARDLGASVLLSSGTGTGQLDFTSGVVKSNLVQILATALTETAGQIAAAFKKFFDVASPVFTAQSVNQTGDAYARLGAPAGASLSSDVASIKTDTGTTLPGRLPAALVGGRMDASVGAYASGQMPLQPTVAGRTLDVSAGGEAGVDWANVGSPTTTNNLSGTTVKAVTDAVTAGTVSDKTGYALSAAGVQAIWDALTSALTTVGSIGKLLVDRIDAAISSRGTGTALDAAGVRSAVGLASANLDTQLDAIPTAAENADAIWDEALSGHSGAGSAGLALATASSGGVDPSVLADAVWDEALSGHSTAGTAGKKLTDLANADLSGVATAAALAAVQADTDDIQTRLPAALVSGRMASDAVAISGSTTAADNVEANIGNLDAAISTRSTYTGADTAGTTTLLARIASALTITGGKVDVNDKTGFALSAAGVQAIWDALTSALTTVGSIGKRLADYVDAAISSRGTGTALDAAGVRSAVGLASANLDTQLAAIDAKTTNLPASPAAVGSAMTLTAAYDAAKTAAQAGDAMTLTTGERNAVADALLDRADAVETGITPRGALRLGVAADAGKTDGAATTTFHVRNVADSKNRVTATVDADGNRTATSVDVS